MGADVCRVFFSARLCSGLEMMLTYELNDSTGFYIRVNYTDDHETNDFVHLLLLLVFPDSQPVVVWAGPSSS